MSVCGTLLPPRVTSTMMARPRGQYLEYTEPDSAVQNESTPGARSPSRSVVALRSVLRRGRYPGSVGQGLTIAANGAIVF